ncbi:MAG: GNAT family N-acetyltransferase [Pseudomonadota bacterium]|nr:GNAT family N-acetyltransferase [Pseudomonadota bacterium]
MAQATIREATPLDPAWVVARHGELYEREFGFSRDFGHDIAAKMQAFLDRADPLRRLWIAEMAGMRAGSIAISEKEPKVAFLNFVLVEPEFRGRGLADAMMNRALDHARMHAMSMVSLETYSCLEGARRLYRRHGFVVERVAPGIERFGRRFDQEFWSLQL